MRELLAKIGESELRKMPRDQLIAVLEKAGCTHGQIDAIVTLQELQKPNSRYPGTPGR